MGGLHTVLAVICDQHVLPDNMENSTFAQLLSCSDTMAHFGLMQEKAGAKALGMHFDLSPVGDPFETPIQCLCGPAHSCTLHILTSCLHEGPRGAPGFRPSMIHSIYKAAIAIQWALNNSRSLESLSDHSSKHCPQNYFTISSAIFLSKTFLRHAKLAG